MSKKVFGILMSMLMVAAAGFAIASVASTTDIIGAPCPSTTYQVSAPNSIQTVVTSAPIGATICIHPGTYRMQNVKPKDGQTLWGEPGAILNGSRVLTGWTVDTGRWRVGGQTQNPASVGECAANYPGCSMNEDLFFDDVIQTHVTSLAAVVSGTWWLDAATDTIYVGSDPTGHNVETSITAAAVDGSGSNVTVTGLIVEKYANQAQRGAVDSAGSASGNWNVHDNEIRFNHGIAVFAASKITVANNFIHHQGQLGVGGYKSDNSVFSGNEIAFNNTAHFYISWEAGGGKFSVTDGVQFINNYVHHNDGRGIWTDGNNIRTVYDGNRFEFNGADGLFHEISYDAVIKNNTCLNNGLTYHTGQSGACILIDDSPNVEVYNNTSTGDWNHFLARQNVRTAGTFGPYEISNLWMHDNTSYSTVGNPSGGWVGLTQAQNDNSFFTSRNNRWTHNTYCGPITFEWLNTTGGQAFWQSNGQDLDGTFISTDCGTPPSTTTTSTTTTVAPTTTTTLPPTTTSTTTTLPPTTTVAPTTTLPPTTTTVAPTTTIPATTTTRPTTTTSTTTTVPAGDTTPPSAVPTCKATAKPSHDVALSWTAATDNVGVVKYRLSRIGRLWYVIGLSVTDNKPGSGLITYEIKAMDAAGNIGAGCYVTVNVT